MNKNEVRTETEEFLREARALIADEQVVLVPRLKNMEWVEELEITEVQVWEIIERLTVNNFCAGPEEDRDRSGTFLWKFGGTVEKQETYIKLKIEVLVQGKILKCLSFHKSDFFLKYPLRSALPPRE